MYENPAPKTKVVKTNAGRTGLGMTADERPTSIGMEHTSGGPVASPTRQGNPKTGMGVQAGKAGAHEGDGIEAGHARMRRAKNQTGAGPQGSRG